MTNSAAKEMAAKWNVVNFADSIDEEYELTAEETDETTNDDNEPCCYGFLTSRGQSHEVDCFVEMANGRGREWLSRFNRAMDNDF